MYLLNETLQTTTTAAAAATTTSPTTNVFTFGGTARIFCGLHI